MSDMRTRDPARDSASRTDTGAGSVAERERSAFRFESPEHDETIPGLVRRLADEGSHLAEQQMKLVEAEVRSGIDDLKQSAGAMAGAAVLGIAGIGVVLMGVAFLLGSAMPLWLGTLIVGVAGLVGAYAMFLAGQKKLQSSSLSIDRTKRTLERAPAAISGNTNEERRNDR
jgi:hypothetical protein